MGKRLGELPVIARNANVFSAAPPSWVRSGSAPFLAVYDAKVWSAFQRLGGLKA